MKKTTSRYSEIIDLPHHQAEHRPHMPVASRAAQFAPFAALTGFDDMIKITAESQNCQIKKILDPDKVEILERKLCILEVCLSAQPNIEVIYFDDSINRVGGAYVSCSGYVKKIKKQPIVLVMQDGKTIFGKDIIEINGEVFQNYDLE